MVQNEVGNSTEWESTKAMAEMCVRDRLCIGTAAEGSELDQIEKLAEGPEYRLSFALVEWLERLLSAGKETAIS